VFCNLISNAVKFSPQGAPVRLSSTQESGRAVVRVGDVGEGIAPEMLGSVFELFRQADNSLARSQGGLGVGLTIAKLITELHGGTIEARSEGAGRGSEFIVALPLLSPAAQAGAGDSQAAAPGGGGVWRKLLVVDDNVDAAKSLAILLRTLGHRVETAHDGETALRLHGALRPDAVLLDLGMPGMDGFEVARRLRHADPALLIVAVSGYGAEADRRKAKTAGFDHHMTKPVEIDALVELIAGHPPARSA
jgi:CheY-like chemotaxis protein